MARPALSAARGLDILAILAATPERGLTLSEIMRASGINVASCHAVITVLVERGYLLRDERAKTYTLGPVAFATGQAAMAAQPLLAHAEDAARALVAKLPIPVMMSAAVGDEIVGIVAIPDSAGRSPLLRTGERRPRVPPIGAPFVAWSGEPGILAWLESAPDPAMEPSLRRAVKAIRDRGFEVLIRRPRESSIKASGTASQLLAMAGPGVSGFHPLGPDMALPDRIDPHALYDVTMIAAPIFDRYGACAFNLCLGPFPNLVVGSTIIDFADQLLEACVRAMQADRAR